MVKNKGFTLIELILVIAIIGILAAILIPAFKSYKEQQRMEANLQHEYNEEENVPKNYIRNDVRTTQSVKLKRHNDGTLWACNTRTKDCYKVEK